MNNIAVLLHKEWLEFKQQRALLLSLIFVPLLLTLIPLVALYAIGHTPSKGDIDEFSELSFPFLGVAFEVEAKHCFVRTRAAR